MNGDNPGSWDEFRWELFLREEEKKVARFFKLLRRCRNQPKKAKSIARKLGLNLDDAHLEALLSDKDDPDSPTDPQDPQESGPRKPSHPVIAHGDQIIAWVESVMFNHPSLISNPLLQQFIMRTPICRTHIMAILRNPHDKLAPAMLIALLKRGLAAANDCLNALLQLAQQNLLPDSETGKVLPHLHSLRNAYVDAIGILRQEWLRRRNSP